MIKIITAIAYLVVLSNVCIAQVVTDSNAKQYLRDAYQEHHGMDIPEPFYVRGPIYRYANYNLSSGNAYLLDTEDGWTAAIWDVETNRLLSVFLELDGTSHFRQDRKLVVPRCDIRTAVFINDNGKTNFLDRLDLWNEEIGRVNQDWSNYLFSQGYSAPAAHLNVTNFVGVTSELPLKSKTESALEYLSIKGYAAEDFDVFVWVTLDPQNTAGGGAANHRINIGHFMGASDEFYEYTDRQIYLITYATFAHELAHLFGWDHTTTETDFSSNYIIIDPGYYGWTDVDGDGIVEIVDPTPYGRDYLSDSTQPITCNDGGPNTQTGGQSMSSVSSESVSTSSASSSTAIIASSQAAGSSQSEISSSSQVTSTSSSAQTSSFSSSERSCEEDNSCIALGAFGEAWNLFYYLWFIALAFSGLKNTMRLKRIIHE